MGGRGEGSRRGKRKWRGREGEEKQFGKRRWEMDKRVEKEEQMGQECMWKSVDM